MPIYAVSVDIGPGDHRPVRSLYTRFHNEVRKGRRPGQVSVNGSFVLLHTPETTVALMARILNVTGFQAEYDRVSIIDMAARRITSWGIRDASLEANFPVIAFSYDNTT